MLKTGLRFRRLALRPELQRLPSGRPHPRGGLGPGGTPPGPAGVCEQLRGHDFPGRPVPSQTRLHREWVRVGLVSERFGLNVDGSTVGFVNAFGFFFFALAVDASSTPSFRAQSPSSCPGLRMRSSTWSSMPSSSTTRTAARFASPSPNSAVSPHSFSGVLITPPPPLSFLQIYITCQLNVVPANDPQAPQKACTFVNGRYTAPRLQSALEPTRVTEETALFFFSFLRWLSANGNDYLCANCQSHGGAGHGKPSTPGKFGPRGFAKAENQWSSGTQTKSCELARLPPGPVMVVLRQVSSVFEQDAQVGPLVVLSGPRSGPLPARDLPPVLNNILKPRPYGSQWRSVSAVGKSPSQPPPPLPPSGGLKLTCVGLADPKKAPPHDVPSPDQEETSEDASGEELESKVRC